VGNVDPEAYLGLIRPNVCVSYVYLSALIHSPIPHVHTAVEGGQNPWLNRMEVNALDSLAPGKKLSLYRKLRVSLLLCGFLSAHVSHIAHRIRLGVQRRIPRHFKTRILEMYLALSTGRNPLIQQVMRYIPLLLCVTWARKLLGGSLTFTSNRMIAFGMECPRGYVAY
jgi:hypothetical protein